MEEKQKDEVTACILYMIKELDRIKKLANELMKDLDKIYSIITSSSKED